MRLPSLNLKAQYATIKAEIASICELLLLTASHSSGDGRLVTAPAKNQAPYEPRPVAPAPVPDEPAVTASEFKKAVGKFASGVTIVTVKTASGTHGMTASAFFSLSLDPPLIAIAVNNRSKLHTLLSQAQEFGITILASDQSYLADHFSGQSEENVRVQFVETGGVPFIRGALAHIRCKVAAKYEGGDHTIYTALVCCALQLEDFDPLVYFSGQ